MDNFEIAFSLVMLVLGLAIVDVLAGLVRTLRRPDIRTVGWLTPLLGVAVICDLTTFWGMIASMRNIMPSLYQSLSIGMLLCSVYYVAAGMVFPPDDTTELNRHYFAYRRASSGSFSPATCRCSSTRCRCGPRSPRRSTALGSRWCCWR